MCFSATASFVAAAGLAPVGIVSLVMARRLEPERWRPLALMPILFAIQQALEGCVWLGLEAPAVLLGCGWCRWPIWALRMRYGPAGSRGAPCAWRRVCWLRGKSAALISILVLWILCDDSHSRQSLVRQVREQEPHRPTTTGQNA